MKMAKKKKEMPKKSHLSLVNQKRAGRQSTVTSDNAEGLGAGAKDGGTEGALWAGTATNWGGLGKDLRAGRALRVVRVGYLNGRGTAEGWGKFGALHQVVGVLGGSGGCRKALGRRGQHLQLFECFHRALDELGEEAAEGRLGVEQRGDVRVANGRVPVVQGADDAAQALCEVTASLWTGLVVGVHPCITARNISASTSLSWSAQSPLMSGAA